MKGWTDGWMDGSIDYLLTSSFTHSLAQLINELMLPEVGSPLVQIGVAFLVDGGQVVGSVGVCSVHSKGSLDGEGQRRHHQVHLLRNRFSRKHS